MKIIRKHTTPQITLLLFPDEESSTSVVVGVIVYPPAVDASI